MWSTEIVKPLRMVESPEINARYVWSEDQIYITQGAVWMLQQDELAALIAHELGHRALKHGPRCMVLEAAAVLCAAGALVALDWWAVGAVIANGITIVMWHRWLVEFEADRYASRATSWSAVYGLLRAIARSREKVSLRLSARLDRARKMYARELPAK